MKSVSARSAARSRLELHFRRGRRVRSRLEKRLRTEAGGPRDDTGGKEVEARVVVPHGLIEASSLDGDSILGPFELGLQRQEILIRLEIGVSFDDDEQSAQRPRELVLDQLKALERLRIVQRLGAELHACRAGAGLRDLFQ